jgi:hypothetical protein
MKTYDDAWTPQFSPSFTFCTFLLFTLFFFKNVVNAATSTFGKNKNLPNKALISPPAQLHHPRVIYFPRGAHAVTTRSFPAL